MKHVHSDDFSTMSEQNNTRHMYKLAQFYQALYVKYLDYEHCAEILKKEGDVNYQLPGCKYLRKTYPELIGNTLLHLAVDRKETDTFHDLLSRGADFTIKNGNGFDVLHLAVDKCDKRYNAPYKFEGALQDPFIDTLLNVEIHSGNFKNPCDPNGISYFHAACIANNIEAVRFFLNNGVSVNQAIHKSSKQLPGYTPLHIAAKCSNLETVEILLDHGADVSLRNSTGMTPLHVLLEEKLDITNSQKYDKEWDRRRSMLDFERNEKILELILANRHDIVQSTGITPLHVACTMRDATSAVEYLNDNDVDVNCTVDERSPLWIGYTPLHFAALFNFDTVKLLIQKRADFLAKDAEGVTPLDICLERYDIYDVHLIFSSHSTWKDLVLSDGKTKLVDFIGALRDLDEFKSFSQTAVADINARIPIDSTLWPGCTMIHVILYFYRKTGRHSSESRVQLYHQMIAECLINGADIGIENADGNTPLDLACRLDRKHVIHLLFQHRPVTENLVGNNGLSYLHIACAIKSRALVNALLSKVSDIDRPTRSSCTWSKYRESEYSYDAKPQMRQIPAGSTALHIAVATGNVAIVRTLLKRGADPHAKDRNDMTPIHWILLSTDRKEMAKTLMSSSDLKDSLSNGGLSYLHVASLANNAKALKKLLDAGADIDSEVTHQSEDSIAFLRRYAGYTALHFAMEHDSVDAAKLLVQRGADLFRSYESVVRHERIVAPLYSVLDDKCFWTDMRNEVLSRFLREDVTQERALREIGLTMLHFFCYRVDVTAIRDCLDRGADVNARLHSDSPLWPGCTALHVLLKAADPNNYYDEQLQEDADLSLDLLLDSGADVGLSNAEGDSALHVAHRTLRSYGRDNLNPAAIRQRRVNILLEHLKDFTTGHANHEGVSHFHIACNANHLDTLKVFLGQEVDVNQTTDFFSEVFPGYSPLHFAIDSLSKRNFGIHNQLEVIRLLLDHGADPNAEDSEAQTPLHKAAKSEPSRESFFEILVEHGADVQAKNILGKTAFEVLLKSKTATTEEIRFFLSHGISANTINSISKEGYLAMTLYKDSDGTVKTFNFETVVESMDVRKANSNGYTAIHNVVSTRVGSIDDNDCADVIEKLKSLGCDIDCQDNLGQTALHVATWFRNWNAVSALLKAGMDVDIIDLTGKSAFDYIFEPSPIVKEENCYDDTKVKTMAKFVFHVHKLHRCKLDVSEINKRALEKAMEVDYFGYSLLKLDELFDEEMRKIKSSNIGSDRLDLYNFLSETGTIAAFPSMTQWEKQAITEFFERSHRYKLHRELRETASLLKLQYKKALARLSLIEPAKVSIHFLLKFSLPDLCSEAILKFLQNSELKSLIDATT